MRVDGHGHSFFKRLEEYQGYTDQRKDPDNKIHAIVGHQHRLPGHDPLEIGRASCRERV